MSDPQIVPHPDVDSLSNSELRDALGVADERLEILHKLAENDRNPILEPWLIQERQLILAALKRRNIGSDSIPHLRENNPAESFSALLTWEQFLSATPSTREWMVHAMIPTGLGVIQGRGKQGKSTLVIHLCRAVGLANQFLGRDTRQSPAVYINYEMPDDYLQSLIRSAEVPAESYVINRPEPILSLNTIDALVSKVGSSNGLLVIDSFRGAFKLAGKAENLAGEAGVLLRQLQELAIAKHWFFLLVIIATEVLAKERIRFPVLAIGSRRRM